MPDTDVDIDPALDAHLRRVLREVAATVTGRDSALVALSRLHPPSVPRASLRWVAAAVMGAAAVGAVYLAGRRETTSGTMGPSDLAAACASALRLDAGASAEFPDPASSQVVSFLQVGSAEPAIASIGDTAFELCQVSSADGRVVPLASGAYQSFPEPPGDEELQVIYHEWRPDVPGSAYGPGTFVVLGRAGSDVSFVELGTATSGIDGTVRDGWFVISGPVQAGESVAEPTIAAIDEATLTTFSETRLDLLDVPTESEACAASGDECVEQRLRELRDAARDIRQPNGSASSQAELLDDLVVTDDERLIARATYASCLSSAGLVVRMVGDEVVVDGDVSNEAVSECAATHLDFVEQAWELLDAQRRVLEG